MKPLFGSPGTRLQESRLQLAGERHRVWSEAILGQIMLFAPPPPATQLYSVLYDRLGWLLVCSQIHIWLPWPQLYIFVSVRICVYETRRWWRWLWCWGWWQLSCDRPGRTLAGPPANTRAAALQLEPGKSSEIFQFHVKIRNIARAEHFTLPEHWPVAGRGQGAALGSWNLVTKVTKLF